MDDAAWRAAIAEHRAEWEALYAGPDSPLSPEAQAKFPGLAWFPPDPAFRLRGVKLDRYATPRAAKLPATGPDAVAFVEVGVVRFRIRGTDCALTVFEPAPGEVEPEDTYLFIPFRDETSGKETYGGGRYFDFEPREDDLYEIDLNRAYPPYCAYDDEWACTLPPPENRIPVRVEAGGRS